MIGTVGRRPEGVNDKTTDSSASKAAGSGSLIEAELVTWCLRQPEAPQPPGPRTPNSDYRRDSTTSQPPTQQQGNCAFGHRAFLFDHLSIEKEDHDIPFLICRRLFAGFPATENLKASSGPLALDLPSAPARRPRLSPSFTSPLLCL